ncbi:tRNA guanosine(34) transglycosylase Tgt [Propionibacterium freudenreichii]|uniref:tRNA guanosine(34) transglycosylase Tgt n=1 Tax=Propionibacterium freudenreichii TaxID=1744 RepID=UPI0005A5C438|nr:Queuine tRNA-ribosyltransferase [Propionibacterium freudenreichii]SBN41112.1 TRNA-guanine transglycosylase [Propionibacterium freudenreichii]SCQ56601.1 TRNA-guanine transglycosylase [Propionibacterium freudenreichii]SCQ58988.1 TRNA-guanine transglycosylase [Propionibacterium freudenreichii]SCQ63471.1 TRNA-guanine transglycosylase [Propionibacterium freudenreichii]
MCAAKSCDFSFSVDHVLPNGLGRSGTITTPHGPISTPAFVVVGTKATVKTVTPEQMDQAGAQAVLANAFHLYLQPGPDIVDEAGGLGWFMNWPGPSFTDSGGFQVMSLGVGFKKVLAMDVTGMQNDDVIAEGKQRDAQVDEDGVTFRSPLDGSTHRFTAEVSMGVQHQLGADIMFAFDELTTLMNTRGYQEDSVRRTQRWAQRCVDEHFRLTDARSGHPYQALFGVVQGAQYEDLRREACRGLRQTRAQVPGHEHEGFDGYGIGGAIEKQHLGDIVGWCAEELPDDKPRHLLGISEPDDLFAACAAGADTFDCVNPSRTARNGAIYTARGRYNVTTAANRRAFVALEEGCDCYTCTHYTRAYLHHMFKAHEFLGKTLATIHNERFTIRLVDSIRHAVRGGEFDALRTEFLGSFYGGATPGRA